MTLTKIEKKALCIVISHGYNDIKTPSNPLWTIFDKHCDTHGNQGKVNYTFTLQEAYSKALDKLGLYEWAIDNKNYLENRPYKNNKRKV